MSEQPTVTVEKLTAPAYITHEAIEDGPFVGEALALLTLRSPGRRRERYRRVYDRGYRDALEDIRSGRLVLDGGFFRLGEALR